MKHSIVALAIMSIGLGAAQAQDVVKLGSAAPLTGTISHLGKDLENGSRMAVDAINAQNAKFAGLKQADIDALDQKWRAEVEAADKPMIDEALASPLSKFLVEQREKSGGVITELFVTDDKGLNVGQSDPTSDYWQGDEAKWQKSFQGGPGAIFVDDVEKDESTQQLQTQVSATIVDPKTGAAIGAVTVGINVDGL